jgi:polyhydroxybutyrate depolymerase
MTSALGDPDSLTETVDSIHVDGRSRSFISVAPAGLPTGSPMVIVFHGSNQSGKTVREFAGGVFDDLAAREHLVVVYPDAYKGLWNDARISSDFPARREGYDDVAFFRTLVDHFVKTAGVDARSVYVVGYSNGAQLVNRLIHEVGDMLAGAALISATQPAPENFVDRKHPVALPVLLIHGTRDRLVPYEGGMASLWGFRPRGLGLSHLATAQYFAARNGISSTATTEVMEDPAGRTSIEVRNWTEPGKPPVRAYTIKGGGHVIPNPVRSAPFIYGRTAKSLDSARAMWDFFSGSSQ